MGRDPDEGDAFVFDLVVWDGTDPAAGGDGGYFGGVYVAQAFTDGESVLLLIEGESGGAGGLVALDPADGDPAGQDVSGYLVAVDGHLLEINPGGIRGLG